MLAHGSIPGNIFLWKAEVFTGWTCSDRCDAFFFIFCCCWSACVVTLCCALHGEVLHFIFSAQSAENKCVSGKPVLVGRQYCWCSAIGTTTGTMCMQQFFFCYIIKDMILLLLIVKFRFTSIHNCFIMLTFHLILSTIFWMSLFFPNWYNFFLYNLCLESFQTSLTALAPCNFKGWYLRGSVVGSDHLSGNTF